MIGRVGRFLSLVAVPLGRRNILIINYCLLKIFIIVANYLLLRVKFKF